MLVAPGSAQSSMSLIVKHNILHEELHQHRQVFEPSKLPLEGIRIQEALILEMVGLVAVIERAAK